MYHIHPRLAPVRLRSSVGRVTFGDQIRRSSVCTIFTHDFALVWLRSSVGRVTFGDQIRKSSVCTIFTHDFAPVWLRSSVGRVTFGDQIRRSLVCTIFTHDFALVWLRSSVGRETMFKSSGRGFDSRRGPRLFFFASSCPPVQSLLGLTRSGKFMGSPEHCNIHCRINPLIRHVSLLLAAEHSFVPFTFTLPQLPP